MINKGTVTRFSPAVWIPYSLKEAWDLKQQFGSESCFIAGGTLLQTYWEKGIDCPLNLISLEHIKEMKGMGEKTSNGQIETHLGALTTLDFCRHHPLLLNNAPLLVDAVRNIASPAIRNKATIGGNIVGGYGDLIPALLVLDALVTLYDDNKLHQITLSDYLKNENMFSKSLLVNVYFPNNQKINNKNYFFKKIGHREAFSQSIVTISGCCQLNEQKEISIIRLAVGGTSISPNRLNKSEQLILDSPITNNTLNKVYKTIKEEFNPVSDAFSSAEYKKTITANMIVSEIAKFVG